MNLFRILIFYVILEYHPIQNQDQNLFESYANASAAIANYFQSGCVYFLVSSESQDKSEFFKTAKYVSSVHKKLSSVQTISGYFGKLNRTSDLEFCYMPLQVVIDNNEDTAMRDEMALFSPSITAPDQNGGIWLLFLKSFDQYFIKNYFRNIEARFDVEIIVAFITHDQVHFKEVYRAAPGFPLRQIYFGNWSLSKGLSSPKNPMPYFRRNDFEGFEFKVGYAEIPPMTIIEKKGSMKFVRGFIGDVWSVIQSAINASSRYIESSDLGAKNGDTWTGLVGQLVYDKIDIAVSPFIWTRARTDVIKFSLPLVETKFQIFFQLPGSTADAEGFLSPFATDVWLTIGGWLLLGSIFLYICCRLSDYLLRKPDDQKITLSHSFLMTFMALCGQGSEEVPKKIQARLIFLLTFVLATVLIPCYSANLISYLTVVEPEIPFTNMKEFYDGNVYKMLVRSGSYEYDYFEEGSDVDPYISKIYKRDLKVKSNLPQTNKQGISMLCKNKFSAFFGIDASIEWNLEKTREHREKSNCIITKMINDAAKISIGMAFPNNSPYKSLINHEIRKLQLLGIAERIKRFYWRKYDKKSQDTWTPVKISNVFMIFSIIGVGILVSSGIFIVEFIMKHKKLKKNLYDGYIITNSSNFSKNFRRFSKNLRLGTEKFLQQNF